MASILDWVSTLASPFGSLVDYFIAKSTNEANAQNIATTNAVNKAIADQNVRMQQDTLDWQKSQFQKTMEREDTAMQRGVQDAIAAGLSPLAASPASSAAAPQVSAPQSNYQQQSFQKANPLLGLQTANAVSATMRDIVSNLTEIEKMNIQKSQFQQQFNLDRNKFAYEKEFNEPIYQFNKGKAEWFEDHKWDYSPYHKFDVMIDLIKSVLNGRSPGQIPGDIVNALEEAGKKVSYPEGQPSGSNGGNNAYNAAYNLIMGDDGDISVDDMITKFKSFQLSDSEKTGLFIAWLKKKKNYSETDINTYIHSGNFPKWS